MKIKTLLNSDDLISAFGFSRVYRSKKKLQEYGYLTDPDKEATSFDAALVLVVLSAYNESEITPDVIDNLPMSNGKNIVDILAELLKSFKDLKAINEIRISPYSSVLDYNTYLDKISVKGYIPGVVKSTILSKNFLMKIAFNLLQKDIKGFLIPSGMTATQEIDYIIQNEK